MRHARLPLVAVPRALVPGTRASLPVTRTDLRRGDAVVVVLQPAPGEEPGSRAVGTLAEVEEVLCLGPEACLVRLAGLRLVHLAAVEHSAGGWWAQTGEIDEPGADAAAQVAGAGRALRRYLALRAEAGEPGEWRVEVGADPVAASHAVASGLQVSWPEVQEILEAGDAADRLRRAQAVLEREAELLRRFLGREGA